MQETPASTRVQEAAGAGQAAAPERGGSAGLLPSFVPVVVVGAGIVGLSLAFELARRGARVVVLERDRVGAGAAGVAAGMLAPASEAEHEEPALAQMALESLHLYPAFVRDVEAASGLSCGLRQAGTLLVALTRDDEEELARLARLQQRLGLGCRWLTREQALELEPQLNARITGGLLAPDDHQVDPRRLLAALARAVETLGGRVVSGARVSGFETRGGRLASVTGEMADGAQGRPFVVECETAVLAAGAWCSVDIRWPAGSLAVRPVKGQVVRLRGPELVRHVVRTPAAYLVPRADGELVVGATMEEQGFDPAPTAGAVMELLWNARLAVPAVYDLQLAEVSVGFRPAARNHMPIVGPTEVEGLYVATGHFRHGVLLAPATAVLLAGWMLEGKAPTLLAPFRPGAGHAAGASGADHAGEDGVAAGVS